MMPNADQDASASSLFSDLARESGALFREEIALAKAEMREKLDETVLGAALAAAGFGLAFGGIMALLASAILGLSLIFSPWHAALIVGITALVFGALLMAGAWLTLRNVNLVPERTIRSLRAHADWVRGKMS